MNASGAIGIRQLKNSLARYIITLGGVSVLLTLVLIFMYLLYIIIPIFESANVEYINTRVIEEKQPLVSAGVDDLQQVTYQLTAEGELSFYQITDNTFRKTGDLLLSKKITDKPIRLFANGNDDYEAVIDSENKISMYEIEYTSEYLSQGRYVSPKVNLLLNHFILDELTLFKNTNQSIVHFDFTVIDEQVRFIFYTNENTLFTSTVSLEKTDVKGEQSLFENVSLDLTAVDQVLLSSNAKMAFIRANNSISLVNISMPNNNVIDVIQSTEEDKNITTMALLAGSNSLLVGYDNGTVSQWFDVAITDENGIFIKRKFKEIRQFSVSTNEPVYQIYPERYRKSFYTLTPSGELSVFYTTSEAHLWQGKLNNIVPSFIRITPRADAFIAVSDKELRLFSIKNEHPEVTWHALWQEVWYEGYQEPSYIWQSTSGTDDFEAKFSLIPLSFGTLKAALYAMMFAVPIALSAAIYTAFFMPTSLRRKVKPTIELMEALPTVIIGFLAGLWLAPIIENYLPAVFLICLLFPVSILLTAFSWSILPNKIKTWLPESSSPLMLIPVLILTTWLAFHLSPIIELTFFNGDIREHITNEWGLNFDQRNALVVGIAMGFAVIPTIFSIAEDAIFSVPKHLTSGSLALGATPWQTLIKVVLLTASPGIFSAIMMGLGRAVGETMIVLMATGNTPVLDWSVFQGMRTLAANIAVEMPESEVASSHYRILFLAAFVLFVFTFFFNTLAELVRQRLREKYSEL